MACPLSSVRVTHHGAGLGRVEQRGGRGDQPGLVHAEGALVQHGLRAWQADVQVIGQVQQVKGAAAGLGQRAG
jgi:hypothetical protein